MTLAALLSYSASATCDRTGYPHTHQMTGEQGFFQIATGLIPALLFGGLLFNRAHLPDKSKPFRDVDGLAMVGIAALGFLSIVAEATAISGAIGGSVTPPGRLLVIAVILIGMVLIILNSIAPRMSHLIAQRVSSSPIRRSALSIMAVLLAVSATLSAIQIDGAIKFGNDSKRIQLAKELSAEAAEMDRRIDKRGRRIRQISTGRDRTHSHRQPANRRNDGSDLGTAGNEVLGCRRRPDQEAARRAVDASSRARVAAG